jgi:hypothetical protein
MRKLIVTCQCGQRMQVPQSAFGKVGMCPTCGHTIRINNQNTARPGGTVATGTGRPFQRSRLLDTSEQDKRRYGEAVDLCKTGRFGEALAIFESLAHQYPGHQGIENGRSHCLRQLHGPGLLESDGRTESHPQGAFDRETVRQVVLNKMLRGGSEEIQLQAAELAARILGMLGEGETAAEKPPVEHPAKSEEIEEAHGNGKATEAVETEMVSDETGADVTEAPQPPPFTIDIEADQAAAAQERGRS